MTTRLALAVAMTLGLALPAYSASAATPAAANAQQANPFFADSPLPLHFPQFDKIKDSDFAPAFDAGMAQQLKEVEAIANNKAKPTFDNTIIALEKSGDILDRATTVFFSLVGADTNDTRKKLQADYSAGNCAAHRAAKRCTVQPDSARRGFPHQPRGPQSEGCNPYDLRFEKSAGTGD
mgnify:CR=1 FL=1